MRNSPPSEVNDLINEVIKHKAPPARERAQVIYPLNWFEFEEEIVVVEELPSREDKDHELATKAGSLSLVYLMQPCFI